MKTFYIIAIFFLASPAFAQQIDSVNAPERVVYNYSDPALVEKAKQLIKQELLESPSYQFNNTMVIVGPVLWTRYKKISELKKIKQGNVIFRKSTLEGKATQDLTDFKKVWNQVRSEINADDLVIRKLTYNELDYYWTVISFDIDEPLLIAESNGHRFILNLTKDMKLVWLDEAPESHR